MKAIIPFPWIIFFFVIKILFLFYSYLNHYYLNLNCNIKFLNVLHHFKTIYQEFIHCLFPAGNFLTFFFSNSFKIMNNSISNAVFYSFMIKHFLFFRKVLANYFLKLYFSSKNIKAKFLYKYFYIGLDIDNSFRKG